MINFLVNETKNTPVYTRDFMDRTPLHDAASWSTDDEDENKKRVECIKLLVALKADINATDIRRETPLHVACKKGSQSLVKCLFDLKADFLVTNIQDFNCLEVAIEAKNDRVVKYLLENERAFELMRNAQNQDTDNTPMRKLIRSMPDMALLILKKCTLTVGVEKSHIHMEIYNYEFFEDQYFIEDWKKGKNRFLFI
jgi:ankyrin repeat protein